LRPVTDKQNQENRKGPRRNSRTGIRGVSKYTYSDKYRAEVQHNGRSYGTGLHDTLEEAEAAVIALRLRLFTHNDIDRRAS
jgi:hypothetical protein